MFAPLGVNEWLDSASKYNEFRTNYNELDKHYEAQYNTQLRVMTSMEED